MKARVIAFALSVLALIAFATGHADEVASFIAAFLVIHALRRDDK